ncbi:MULTISPECIES: spermidine synthase [Devosia]|uniref:spermidine synthase n=1 Tax=Devosia TaxID=46913 RepID=UPI000CE94DE5|nr:MULTISPECIES: spermidine synthase [Devosia]AVF04645.1 spermidine synthase [Devosia sp. I507]
MIPWQKLDETIMPGGGVLKLMQRGTEFSIMSNNIGLMNSRMSGSEEQLATHSAARIGKRPKARILIGGLGMGFTLRAALSAFGPDCQIVIAELVPAVIAWARGPLAPIHGTSLDDPRVTIHQGDVATAITSGKPFDAILLDVDNGPDGLFRPENDRLYSASGLGAAKAALTPGGHLAVWSAYTDAPFTKRLRQSGMTIEEIPVRERSNGKGGRHLIWFATKPGR